MSTYETTVSKERLYSWSTDTTWLVQHWCPTCKEAVATIDLIEHSSTQHPDTSLDDH